jgi:hypothetical protein
MVLERYGHICRTRELLPSFWAGTKEGRGRSSDHGNLWRTLRFDGHC